MIHLHKIFPYLFSLTDQMDANSNGKSNACYVRIRPNYKDDKGLVAHEVEGHVTEWWTTTSISAIILAIFAYVTQFYGFSQYLMALPALSIAVQPLFYAFSKRYRLWSETRAYKIQLKYPVDGEPNPYKDLYATWLSEPEPEGYGLQDICSKEQAVRLLS